MPHGSIRWAALGASFVLVAAAYAAESKPKPVEPAAPPRPGVEAYNDGVRLMKKEKFAEAQVRFEAAIAEDERMADAHNNLGYSLRKQGPEHYAEALAHYDRAIELDKKLAEAYMYRGVLHMLMGHEDKALEDHKTLSGLNRKLAAALEAAIASGEEPAGLEGLARAW